MICPKSFLGAPFYYGCGPCTAVWPYKVGHPVSPGVAPTRTWPKLRGGPRDHPPASHPARESPPPPPPRSTRLHASPRGLTKTEDLYLKHPTHLRSPASRPLATRKEPRTGAEIEYNAIINQSISPQGRWALASALLRSDWAYRAAICHGLGLGQARPDGAAVELYICGPRREGKVRSGRMMMIPSSPDAA